MLAPSNELPTMSRIEPWDLNNSYLWHKLSGTQASVGGLGAQMPFGGPPLSAQEMSTIELWILTGANP